MASNACSVGREFPKMNWVPLKGISGQSGTVHESVWRIVLMTCFNFMEVKNHIFYFLSRFTIQIITSKKIIFDIFLEVKIFNFSRNIF